MLRQPVQVAEVSFAPEDLHTYVSLQCSLFEGAALRIGLGAAGFASADGVGLGSQTLTVHLEGAPATVVELMAERDAEAPLTLAFKASGATLADFVRVLSNATGPFTVSASTTSKQFPAEGAAQALNGLVARCPFLAGGGG